MGQYIGVSLAFLAVKYDLDLSRMTIGIVGAGNVGTEVEKMATALGMKVMLNDPPRALREGPEGFFELDSILEKADILSLHVPLSLSGDDKTYHMAGSGFIEQAGRPFFFINTSRGPVMDTEAITKGIKSKKTRSAIIDVWENEPGVDMTLLELTALGTPHIAGYSVEGKANGTARCVNAISRHFGLSLDSWHPEDLPGPRHGVIEISNRKLSPAPVMNQAILSTYAVETDSARLKSAPLDFEYLRNHYPIRREFGFYTVSLKDSSTEIEGLLSAIGFNT